MNSSTQNRLVSLSLQKVFILFFFTSSYLFTQNQNNTIERYGIFIGANNGGRKNQTLRYAPSDAQAMMKVMQQLGGLKTENRRYLTQPTPNEVFAAFEVIKRKIAEDNPGRSEFIFYYSGHSDNNGLLLGEERAPFPELKNKIKSISSDVKIAILDSCFSGAFVRQKGGVRNSPFLIDTGSTISGHAFITSSSSDETSQESSLLKGSYFTHHFVSGLRGAADISGDGRITLNEAYRHAYHQTLAVTEKSVGGPQHANYEMDLSGSGELVLTDLATIDTGIVLTTPLSGKCFIRDSTGLLVSEFYKMQGSELRIALRPDTYRVSFDGVKLMNSDTVVLAGKWVIVETSDLKESTRVVAKAKGANGKQNIGILTFETKSDLPSIYAELARNTFTAELSKANIYNILERQYMSDILKEQAFQVSGCTESSCAVEIGKLLNTELIAIGEITKAKENIFLFIKIINIETGETEFSDYINHDDPEDMEDLVSYMIQLTKKVVTYEKNKRLGPGETTPIPTKPSNETVDIGTASTIFTKSVLGVVSDAISAAKNEFEYNRKIFQTNNMKISELTPPPQIIPTTKSTSVGTTDLSNIKYSEKNEIPHDSKIYGVLKYQKEETPYNRSYLITPFQFGWGTKSQIFPTEAMVAGLSLGVISTENKIVLGVTVAPIFSRVGHHLFGSQFAIINRAGFKDYQKYWLIGTQSGIVNYSPKHLGVQLGVVDFTHKLYGFQGAIYNEASFLFGVQAGIVNTANTQRGAQVGLVQVSKHQIGVQAGLVNKATTLYGCQIGLVNLARKLYGVQLGLVNVSANYGTKFIPFLNIGF